jgi:hypothetical protein
MGGYKKVRVPNQGSAGKASVQQPFKSDTKTSGNGGTVVLAKQPGGTRGSKNK